MPRPFAAKQRSVVIVMSSIGERPTQWRVTWRANEKGDERQQEAVLSEGSWSSHADTRDDHVKALAWLARKLWDEMEARG